MDIFIFWEKYQKNHFSKFMQIMHLPDSKFIVDSESEVNFH